MSDTSETDDLARGNHVVPTEWAQQLERERDEARAGREAYKQLAIKHAQERDEARAALMKIEDLFIDGTDIYTDRENMGLIARAALEKIK